MNFEKIIALHRYALYDRGFLYKVALIGHALFLLLFKRYGFESKKVGGNKRTKYLFFKALHRFDYDKLFSQIIGECKGQKTIINSKVEYGINFSFLFYFRKKNAFFKKVESKSFLDKLYLFLSYLFYSKALESIKQYNFDVLVVFADMQPIDNLLVQHYKEKGKITVTLQHGLFVDYEGTHNISAVSYKSVVSHYFLAWGVGNKELIERHNSDCNAIVCGNPAIKKYYNCANVKRKFFTVILDWDVFEKENTEMIDMAEKLAEMIKMDFQVRYHPSNDKSKYTVSPVFLIQEGVLDFMCSEFILGHTSSLIHVAQRLGKKVFKYNTTVPTNLIDKRCLIDSENDIVYKLYNETNSAHSKIKETVNIGPIDNDSLYCYQQFFCNLKV
jgi:hypothetical protein